MSDVESFVRFCESEFGSAVMDREATYIKRRIAWHCLVQPSKYSGLP
jgi:hypothetical protein